MNSFSELTKVLLAANKIVIFPHVNPDGDAIGSAVALHLALSKLGKESKILVDEPVQGNLKFLDKGYTVNSLEDGYNHDVSICVDCGELSRFPKRNKEFLAGKITMCIDHHGSSKEFCDYNIIKPEQAATAELIFYLIEELGGKSIWDKEMAEAIFTGILTDTGSFRYSNTSKGSHEIVARLYDYQIDSNRISVEIYENISKEKAALNSLSISKMELFANGMGAISFVDKNMLDESGAVISDSEGITEDLRRISGVEIAALLKEYGKNEIKVSMRVKHKGDVSKIGAKFGGGGHIKAAGCTLKMPMKEAIELMKQEITANIEEHYEL